MIRIESIISDFREYTNNEVDCSPIQKAYVLAAKAQSYSKIFTQTYLHNALEVAKVLTDLKLDIQSIVSGILHSILFEGKISLEEIKDLLGNETATIVAEMHNILSVSNIPDEKERIAEKMRQMIFASSKDIRIIFVNLAARLVRIRHSHRLYNLKMKALARETLETYAPVAERLGLSHIKIELEDLCFSHLHPKEFKEIQDFCKKNLNLHQSLLQKLNREIVQLLPNHQIEGKIKERIKHYYSIYLKSIRNNVDYDQLHDLLGMRIIVKTVDDCYKTLGLFSSYYRPVSESFKDYISFPKPNGYQSLHIDVYSLDGIGFDVQIRTAEMDRISERGVAAHDAYKNQNSAALAKNINTSWLQDLSNSLNVTSDARESLEIFTRELYSDFAYVFTPKGKIIKLQKSACVIDFAYAIHTEIGEKCVGARINGRNVAIKTKLKHGDKVEVLTSSKQNPSSDWLHHATTSKALAKIRYFLRKEEKKEAEKLGKELFAEQVGKMGKNIKQVLKSAKFNSFLEKSGNSDINAYYCSLGYGNANINNINRLFELPQQTRQLKTGKAERSAQELSSRREGVRIAGIENMMVRYANCCKPLKGEKIIGLVIQGQGVSIHLADCKNILSKGFNPERLVDVEWIKSSSEKLPVGIHLQFDNLIKTNLQIMKFLTGAKVVLIRNDLKLLENTTYQDLTIKIENAEQLEKLLGKLNTIPSVKAHRTTDHAA